MPLVAGVNPHNGSIDNEQYANTPRAIKGPLRSKSRDDSQNISAYVENSFFVLPPIALVAGTQFLHAVRDRKDLFLNDVAINPFDTNPDDSGRRVFDIWNPKAGLLWQVTPWAQVFANVSRSAEVPSFGENSFTSAAFSGIKEQIATTTEIGTRGRRPDFTWELALYRAEIENELQCLFSAFGNCTVVNADRTVHRGIEVGFGGALLKGIFVGGTTPDKLWLNVAYTLNDFFFDGDAKFGDNTLPGAPRHLLRSELLYKHPSGVFFGPNAEWVPQAYDVDSANTLKTEAYAIWGLKLGYGSGGPVSAYIEGRNLSDVAYIASASIIDVATPALPLFKPGTGRAVYAGVKYKW